MDLIVTTATLLSKKKHNNKFIIIIMLKNNNMHATNDNEKNGNDNRKTKPMMSDRFPIKWPDVRTTAGTSPAVEQKNSSTSFFASPQSVATTANTSTNATASATRKERTHSRVSSMESMESLESIEVTHDKILATSTSNLHRRHHTFTPPVNDIHNDSKFKEHIYRMIQNEVLNDEEIKSKLIKDLKESMKKHYDDHNTHWDMDIEHQTYQESDKLHYNNQQEEGQQHETIRQNNLHNNHSFFVRRASNLFRIRRSQGGSLSPWHPDENDHSTVDRIRSLENDTFTLMMLSTNYGFAWIFLFLLFIVQCCLLMGILAELVFERGDDSDVITRPLHVPIVNQLTVTICQSFAIIFALFSQRDLLEGVNVFIALFRYENWSQLNILPDGSRVRWSDTFFWFEKVFLSYLMKLSISLLTLFTAMVLILQSTDLIDLLKDFTALFIVASLDNFVYSSICDGYFGYRFDMELTRKERMKIKAETRFTFCLCNKVPLQSYFIGLLGSVMLTIWGYVAFMQLSGAYFFEAHPDCMAFDGNVTNLKFEYWGDGVCDPRLYSNTCGIDGGDCNNYCMSKWINPSPKLWLDVHKTMKKERQASCKIDGNIMSYQDGVYLINGLQPLSNVTLDYKNLSGEFAKCFNESSIYNELNSTLGLFCYFGDFMQELAGRGDVDVKITTE